jgi:hypothetical protein
VGGCGLLWSCGDDALTRDTLIATILVLQELNTVFEKHGTRGTLLASEVLTEARGSATIFLMSEQQTCSMATRASKYTKVEQRYTARLTA